MAVFGQSRFDPIMSFAGVAAIAESPATIDTHFSMAQRMYQHVAIRQFIIYHKEDVLVPIDKQAWKFTEFESLNPAFPVFKIGLNKGDKNISGIIAIVPGSQDNMSRIVTVSLSDFWDLIVRRLVRGFYPDAMPVFFRQQEIEDALIALETTLPQGFSIHLSDVTSREVRSKVTPSQRKEYDTRRWWTDLPWRMVFSEAQEKGEWFTGLKFIIQREDKLGVAHSIASGRVYKKGEIHYDYYHERFSDTIVAALEQRASDRLSLFQARGIRERNYHPSEPIEIAFDFDAFTSVEDVREFGEIMSKYPHSTKAIYHGNPYYHASIADFKDGSSFELWVLSQNKIVIVPQAKSSAQAFERLISYVFTEFNEGTVNVYEESKQITE